MRLKSPLILECIGLLALSLLETAPVFAENASPHLKEINAQIESLQKELKQNELLNNADQVEGQEAMIADWGRYSDEIQSIQARNRQNAALRAQIEELEALKKEPLSNQKNH